jgi:hypothetical protein
MMAKSAHRKGDSLKKVEIATALQYGEKIRLSP